MSQFKITVLSDEDPPEPMLVEVFDMASGPHCQDLGKAIVDLTEARTGMVTVEIEQVA